MIEIRKSDIHFKSELGWLTSYHHFSFADYQDPNNVSFGPLRVFNDDLIQPGTGFGFHPHRDMEIITYVIEGELEHRDNQGNHGIIHPGEVQVMTAGSGIVHSEFNHSKEKPLRLLQIWIYANKRGLKPSWKQQIFAQELRRNILLQIVGSEASTNKLELTIHQDSRIFVASLERGQELEHYFIHDRIGYLFVINGKIEANENTLSTRDSARVHKTNKMSIRALAASEIILLDMPVNFLVNESANAAIATATQ